MPMIRRLLLLAPLALGIASTRAEEPPLLPDFALTDHHGRLFSREHLRGRWSLLAIGYTSCPDVCPFVLANLEAVLTELSTRMSPERLPHVVFLAVDPARDAPALPDYMRSFHPDFLGVTGTEMEIQKVVSGVDGAVRREPADAFGHYLVAHTAFVSVIGPGGHVVAKLRPPIEPGPTTAMLAGLLRGMPPEG
jgi:protein SCO1/2